MHLTKSLTQSTRSADHKITPLTGSDPGEMCPCGPSIEMEAGCSHDGPGEDNYEVD